ncbi:MAG TPA: UbiA family prenyltransferase [Micromonosporaceae bacterium]|nr:UbiA family prenyltransferase [Micromonosporaceae bacterium]
MTRGLIRASHPAVCVGIAALIVALAARFHAAPSDLAVLAAMALLGQLSIGWSNDYLDAARDRAAGRQDKPIVSGDVSRNAVGVAAVVSVLVSAGLGFWLGWWTAILNLVMIGAAWAYNLGLKATVLSGLMYVLGFAPIPAVAASVGDRTSALPWFTVAAGLLGLGAHFANVIYDLDADFATGVRGLPQRVAVAYGQWAVRIIGLGLVFVASLLVAFGAERPVSGAVWVALAVVAAVTCVGLVGRGRVPFVAVFVIAFIDVGLILTLA